jgi:CheY-like chemotaxis protein
MDILVLIAAVWGGFFLLTLALAAANSRSRRAAAETTVIDFRVHPLLLPGDVEQLKPLRDIVTSKMNSAKNGRGKQPANGEKEMIFVVDDDPDIVHLLKHILDMEGFEVRSFTNPEEALTAFQAATRRPSMIVTDYCMEPMNGLELIDRCRETKPDLKTIVISGMVDEQDFRKMPANSDQFIAKPFKVSNLIETLNETLAKAQN